MSTYDNKKFVRELYEVMSRGNLDDLDQYLSSDLTDRNPAPGQHPGIEGVKDLMRRYRSSFSDLRAEVQDQIAEGDKVVSRVNICGRHTGAFQGIAPTGKEFSMAFIDILRLSSGKVVERWGVEDSLDMLTQLGGIPGVGESEGRAA